MVQVSPSKGELNVKTENTSTTPMASTTAGQKVCSGVCWKAMYEGTSTLPPKSGWKGSATRKPTAASIATRPCLISASRMKRTLPSDTSPEQKPAGSKKPSGPAMPARLLVKVTGLKGSGSGAGVASCMEMALTARTGASVGATKDTEAEESESMVVGRLRGEF